MATCKPLFHVRTPSGIERQKSYLIYMWRKVNMNMVASLTISYMGVFLLIAFKCGNASLFIIA